MDVGVVLVEAILSQSVMKSGYGYLLASVPVCPPERFGTGGFFVKQAPAEKEPYHL